MTQSFILNNLLNVCQKNGLLYANDERHLLIPSSSFGILQRDLIDNIGIERMKTFFYKYGYHIGVEDAKEIMKDSSMSLIEKILYGPVFHSLKGHVKAKMTEKELKIEKGSVIALRFKGIWEDSYEAEQHIKNMGIADHPICYTLTGYAAGVVSYITGKKVFFKELQCKGQGAPCCTWEGRLLSDWGEEEYKEFINSKELPILKELEQTYEKLLKEKNNLSIVMKIDNELTDDVVKGNNIESILEIVEKQIRKPVVVEDLYHQVVLLMGITEDQYQPIKNEFQSFLKKSGPIKKITEIDHSQFTRLVAPIYVQEKIVGYCSFLNEIENKSKNEIDSMIIGRLSAMCSVVLLNEKIQLESTERIKGYFLEEIINGKYQTEQEIMKKAMFIHLDFTEGYYAIYLQYKVKKSHYKLDHTFHNEIFETVTKYMSDKGINVLIGQKTDSLLFLLPQKQLGEKKIEHIIYSFLSFLRKRLEYAVWFAGISSLHSKVLKANCAVKEAQTANKLSTRENPVTAFSELGILGVLVNEENKQAIRQIAELTLGNLYKDLDQNKVELIESLYIFLTNGGSFDQTAEQMAISISGLRYRLTKITNLLGGDFREPERRFQLLLALKALMVVEEEWLEIKDY